MYDTLLKFLEYIEFELEVAPDGLHLVDLQRANLCGIEQEVFSTIDEVLDRLSVYANDYFVEPIAEDLGYAYNNWEDLYQFGMENGGYEQYPSLIFVKLFTFGIDKSLEV